MALRESVDQNMKSSTFYTHEMITGNGQWQRWLERSIRKADNKWSENIANWLPVTIAIPTILLIIQSWFTNYTTCYPKQKQSSLLKTYNQTNTQNIYVFAKNPMSSAWRQKVFCRAFVIIMTSLQNNSFDSNLQFWYICCQP